MIALFPINKTWESQSMNIGTHKDTKAIDFGVLNPYNDTCLYAPFDGKVVYVDKKSNGGFVAFESLNKVMYANGVHDYMTVITAHDNNPPKLGTLFKQGELYSHMGTLGGVFTHCHLEVQQGKFKMTKKLTNLLCYKFDNTIAPFDALFLKNDTLIKYSKYKWKRVENMIIDEKDRCEAIKQIKIRVSDLRVRNSPSLSGKVLGYVKKDGIYNDLEQVSRDNYIWHRIDNDMWIADDGSWLESLKTNDYKSLYEETLKKIDNIKTFISQI